MSLAGNLPGGLPSGKRGGSKPKPKVRPKAAPRVGAWAPKGAPRVKFKKPAQTNAGLGTKPIQGVKLKGSLKTHPGPARVPGGKQRIKESQRLRKAGVRIRVQRTAGALDYIDKALSGKYVLEPAAKFAKEKIGEAANYIQHRPGVEQDLMKSPKGRGGTMAAISATAQPNMMKGATKLGANTANDAVDIGAGAIPANYKVGKDAGKDIARGRVPVKAAKELADPFVQTAKHPLKSLVEHPLQTGLMVSGVEAAVGRGAGYAARRGALGPTVRERVNKARVRPDKRIDVGPDHEVKARKRQVGSKDLIRLGVQRAKDRRNPTPEMTTSTGRLGVGRVRMRGDIEDLVDAHEQRWNAVRRARRHEAAVRADDARRNRVTPTGTRKEKRAAKKLNKRSQTKPTAAVTLSAQGIAKAGDLPRFIEEHRTTGASLTHESRAISRQNDKLLMQSVRTAGDKTDAAGLKSAEVSVAGQKGLVERGMLPKEQAERRRLMPYAVRNMKAHVDPEKGLVARDNGHLRQLSNDEIRAHMRAHGYHEDPAFVSHSTKPMRGFSPRYGASSLKIDTPHYTGNAVKTGTHNMHPDVLVEQAAKTANLAAAHDEHVAFMQEFGLRKKRGGLVTKSTKAEADDFARNWNFDENGRPSGKPPIRPVLMAPLRAKGEQVKALVDAINEGGVHDASHSLSIDDTMKRALEGEDLGDTSAAPGKWGFVIDAAARRKQAHLDVSARNWEQKLLQVYGKQWRQVVLATNPKWLVGNHIEGSLRTAIAGAGPHSWRVADQFLKDFERWHGKDARQEFEAATTGGGLFRGQQNTMVTRTADQFEGSPVAPLANALHAMAEKPGPKTIVRGWHAYTHFVFQVLNGQIESGVYQKAMLGKALRDDPIMGLDALHVGSKAIEEAAAGAYNTPTMARLAGQIRDMYGKYDGYGPTWRKLISSVTPFIPWTLSVLKFLTVVMPRDHPILTAALVAANDSTREWRKKHGQFADIFGGGVPGYLKNSIPGKGDTLLQMGRYTPAGVANDPLGTLADSFWPQGMSTLKALQGLDWKDKPLNGHKSADTVGILPRAVGAAIATGEGLVPTAGQIHRAVNAKGSTKTKVRKALGDPFMYTSGHQKTGRKKGKKKVKPKSIWWPDTQTGTGDTWGGSSGGSGKKQSASEPIW